MTGKKQPRRVVRAIAVAAEGRQASARSNFLRRGRSVSSLSPDEATSPDRSSAWQWRFDAQGVTTPGENGPSEGAGFADAATRKWVSG